MRVIETFTESIHWKPLNFYELFWQNKLEWNYTKQTNKQKIRHTMEQMEQNSWLSLWASH